MMHDLPGTIIVDLTEPNLTTLKQNLDDAYSQATFSFNTEKIAVFAQGYSETKK
jgi:hypothetical protein